ncbi:acyl-CoA N-acyltransferase [Phyllosticta citrichinensis]|uniref:Histone acetyltransferase type B catalytic subunit n=1 Tax=Phyllosticta citrichinensis TaxID=1130410 RepID=A0ABR1XZ52_9PEZI
MADRVEIEAIQEFVANSNEALQINLVRRDGTPVFDEPFNPAFTYPIFGEDETIFGYSDLELNLNFTAHDLKPSLQIKYDKKWVPIGETKAMDLEAILEEFLHPDALHPENAAKNGDDAADSKWRPPGQLLHKYSQGDRQFEIWYGSLADPALREILHRMQVMIPLFIEGGTLQNLEDFDWTMERWKIFLLYEVTPLEDDSTTSPYTFAGFSTTYRLWVPSQSVLGQDGKQGDPSKHSSPLESPSRERISQFVVIPPFQGQAHGSHLYNAMMSCFLNDSNVFEVTVEDPNEAFDDLRDWCDLARLRRNPEFESLTVADSVPEDALRPDATTPSHLILPEDVLFKLRRESKISPRQFHRLVEMHTMSKIPAMNRQPARITRKHKAADPNDRRYYFWRHLVKERLYNHNRDQLMQVDASERVERVEHVLSGVEYDYQRLLETAEKRAANGEGRSSRTIPSKRKAIVDDDSEDDDEVMETKRRK